MRSAPYMRTQGLRSMYFELRMLNEAETGTRAEKLFDQAIREYKELLSQSKSLDANRVANCHSWEELAAIIYEAEDTYVNHANGFRRAVRAVGDYESGLQVWAGLLPTDNNMSIMAGGVKLMLGVS